MKQLALGLDAPSKPREAQLRHYHVRSHQTVEEANAGEAKAQAQDAMVLQAFDHGKRLTPTDVLLWLNSFNLRSAPLLTSIRRSLTKAGVLVHHKGDRRDGPRGARESTWSLAPSAPTADSTSTD